MPAPGFCPAWMAESSRKCCFILPILPARSSSSSSAAGGEQEEGRRQTVLGSARRGPRRPWGRGSWGWSGGGPGRSWCWREAAVAAAVLPGLAPHPTACRCVAEEGLSLCPGTAVDGAGGVQRAGKLFHLLPLRLPNSWQMLAQPPGCLGALVPIPGGLQAGH